MVWSGPQPVSTSGGRGKMIATCCFTEELNKYLALSNCFRKFREGGDFQAAPYGPGGTFAHLGEN